MSRAVVIAALLVTSSPGALWAQDPEEARASGLILTVEAGVGEGVVRDARVARAAALFVADGAPVTPFAAAGPFRCVMRGSLEVGFRDRYRFSYEGHGALTLRIDGAVVEFGERLRLRRGGHDIELRYASPPAGATL